MELVQVGEKTYYIKNRTNIGVYKIDDQHVYLIDTGNDQDAGKKILKIMEQNDWKVIGIINTHSNADHIGGNKIIQERTSCKIFANGLEKSFIDYPILESSFLYGGYPFHELRNKFLLAKESKSVPIETLAEDGLTCFPLNGHFFNMIGVKTSDDVYFLADSFFSQETIEKYHLFFLYDVKEFLNTLDKIQSLEGRVYIPSHGEIRNDIRKLVEQNRNKVNEVITKIENFCEQQRTMEEVLQYLFKEYQLTMDENQYVLIGSAVRSYLSYLHDQNRIDYEFIDYKMFWKRSNL